MSIAVLFVLLFLLLFVGAPIAISLGLSSLTVIIFFSQDSLGSVSLKLFNAMTHYTLLAIPFFILASGFLSTGGVAKRLINLALASTGHLKGGIAIASVFSCVLFAAISGSSPATVVAIGSIAIAAMVKGGYTKEYAAGLICNAGTLGVLIPPSIVLVVYGSATDTSVGKLFLAGVVPGLLAGVILAVAIRISLMIKSKREGKDFSFIMPKMPWKDRISAFRKAFFGLLLIFIVLGGIYGGIFTPTEAAAVAAVYGWFVAIFVHRDMGPLKGVKKFPRSAGTLLKIAAQSVFHRDVKEVLSRSAILSIALMFIIANAILFAHVLTTERIPQTVTEMVLGSNLSPLTFLLIMNLVLLIAGNFMEPSAIILILAPIFFPLAVNFGVDPVHLGIIMTVNMEVGLVSPPVGLNLFVTSGVSGLSIEKVIKASLPWLAILVGFLMLVTYVPWLSLALPNLLYNY